MTGEGVGGGGVVAGSTQVEVGKEGSMEFGEEKVAVTSRLVSVVWPYHSSLKQKVDKHNMAL